MNTLRHIFLLLILTLCTVPVFSARHIFIAATHPTYYPHYTAKLNLSTPEAQQTLRNAWNNGEYITAVGFTSSGWMGVLSGGAPYTNQTYKVSSTFPIGYIESQRAKGFMITSLAADAGSWLVVTSAGSGIKDQHIFASAAENGKQWNALSDSISAYQKRGFYISEATYRDRYWIIVMSQVSNPPRQHFKLVEASNIIPYLLKERKSNFEATIIDSDEQQGNILCVTNADESQHRFVINGPINNLLNDSFYIIYIGG